MSSSDFWEQGDDIVELPTDGKLGKLHPPDWMTTPQVRAVVTALSADGGDVRFVGGCVRDALMKRPVTDVDLATPLPPEQMVRRLESNGIKVVPTGLSHGTVTAVVDGQCFEITTLRIDVETDGRHAEVAFTEDWRIDASRRDFTVNALSCTPDGDIYDYFNGLADAAHGKVRFVGVPSQRITEDALRILRFFRFYAQFGQPPADPDGLHACRDHAADIDQLSGERIRVELFKTLLAPDPLDALGLMRDASVLTRLIPSPLALDRLRNLVWLESRAVKRTTVAPEAVRRLAAMTRAPAETCKDLADRLRLSNTDTEALVTITLQPNPIKSDVGAHLLRRILYRLGADRARDLALLAWADELTRTPGTHSHAWIAQLESIDAWRRPELPVKGRDLLKMGLEEGPAIGDHMRAVETWWEDGDYAADRDACLDYLRTHIARGEKHNRGDSA